MTKNMLVVLLAAAGCGTVSPSDDVSEQPDGGAGEVDAGETPVDPKVLSIVPARWKDERNDAIDFASGEPVHSHQGPDVTIAAGGACPVVSRYAYLMDRAPAFGRQVTQNEIAIEVAVPTIPLDPSASAYRLMTAAGAVVVPWTPLGTVPASGRVRVAAYRDDAPVLGTYDGELHFDVRVRDTMGTEQLVSACWTHHPLAAPLYVEPPQAALGATSLMARSLATASHASDLLFPVWNRPSIYSVRITQQTAEPITVSITPGAPAGTYSTTLAHLYSGARTILGTGNCDDNPETCDQTPVPTLTPVTASGALVAGSWGGTIVDEANGETLACSIASCTLPARTAGAAPHSYRVTISISGLADLWPDPTLLAVTELAIGGAQIPGVWLTSHTIRRCAQLKLVNGTFACARTNEYTELLALDRATLAVSAIPLTIASGTPVPYLPNGAVTTPPIAWDGGDGPL